MFANYLSMFSFFKSETGMYADEKLGWPFE